MTLEQILEIIERYKLRIPPTVFYDLKADIVNYEEEFEWCETCKEYDQEKHCCHRWSKVIRDTVEEMKQEPILDKLRAEIEELKPNNPNFKGYFEQNVALNKVLEILDMYKAERSDKE